uniref:Uncharacterized protein n=1 Tax=Pyxicephalus adspersus TaxID=30357 RepID=A0AAV3AKC6_PYXAD|nr:TPA: hypothetical protein GDO54_011138 [Pyxicephalus adspersus]
MEAVKTFNSEGRHQGIEVPHIDLLYSLNDYKPPISKAKMTQITKAAIKAIKFYKHVVQSVEKFIQKCKPEYKVPGLYVIDSIVRQSRHQFGQEKDVFAPRFSNNIINTFQNLYRCPADDKSKIVRVLNLWQKNNVFKSEIIQPLLDMAAGIPPPVVTPVLPSTAAAVSNTPGTPATPVTPANASQSIPDPWIAQLTSTDTLAAVAQILQSPQGQQLQQLVQSLHVQQQKPQPSLLQALDAGLVVQLQALTAQLTAAAASSNTLNPLEQSVSLSKKLMDRFDFGEDTIQNEEPKKEAPSMPLSSDSVNNSLFHQLAEHLQQQNLEHLRHQFLEQQHTPKVAVQETQDMMSESENSATPSQDDSQQAFLEKEAALHNSLNLQQEDMDIEEIQDVTEEMFEKEEKKIIKDEKPRARSRSRSRSPRKRRSRSRSGSRKRKHRKRSRSKSRERKRKTSRSYSSERRAREREKERQKKGLPPIRSKTLSVCSTTLWVGQVDKKATQQDLTNVFEEFGQIESINMIPPRGCAYVCMVHRQDAFRALQKLSSGSCKIGSKVIKIAWALNKGVKTEYKQFWDVDLGVTYIPWEKVKLDDLEVFSEGGMIDQETVNNDWANQRNTESSVTREPISAPAPTTTVQSPVIPKSTILTTQTEAYTQPVAMLQLITMSCHKLSLGPHCSYSGCWELLGIVHVAAAAFGSVVALPPLNKAPQLPRPANAFTSAPQNTVVSSAGILTVQPQPPVTAPVPHLSMPGRLAGMPFLDIRPGLLPQPGTRFALLTPAMPPLPPSRSMLPPALIDPAVHSLPFPPGDIFPHPNISSRLSSDNTPTSEENVPLPNSNIQQEGDQDYRFPPMENVAQPSAGEPNKEIMQAAPENKSVVPAEEVDANARHSVDDHELQDMAVVDPSEGQDKLPDCDTGYLSAGTHETDSKADTQSHDSHRASNHPNYESNLRNIPDSHDSEMKLPLEGRPQFGSPPVDILPPFGRHPLEMRELFTRPPPNGRDNFGRHIPEDHLGRLPMDNKDHFGQPILEGRNHFGRSPMDGREHFGRPPLDARDHFGRVPSDGGRREQLMFHPDKPWGHRGDFDERQHLSFPGFGGPKGFQDERHRHGNYRQEPRNAPGWNRGFDQEANRDFDDRRRPWERHRDRDDRDFAFRREMNGNRFGRERPSGNWMPPQQQIFEYFTEANATNQKEDNLPQVNGDMPETGSEPQTAKKANDSELCEQESSGKVNEEKDTKDAEVESQQLVESTETEGT